jgi:hypothetical protein
MAPGKIPPNVGVLLPGFSDRLAYDLGLLDTQDTFERTKKRALINQRANRYATAEDFSERIRRR